MQLVTCHSSLVTLQNSSSLYHSQDHGDQGNDEQDVDDAANMIAEEANGPKDQKDDGDDVQ